MSFPPGVPSISAAINAQLLSKSVPSPAAKTICPILSPFWITVLSPTADPLVLARPRTDPLHAFVLLETIVKDLESPVPSAYKCGVGVSQALLLF